MQHECSYFCSIPLLQENSTRVTLSIEIISCDSSRITFVLEREKAGKVEGNEGEGKEERWEGEVGEGKEEELD